MLFIREFMNKVWIIFSSFCVVPRRNWQSDSFLFHCDDWVWPPHLCFRLSQNWVCMSCVVISQPKTKRKTLAHINRQSCVCVFILKMLNNEPTTHRLILWLLLFRGCLMMDNDSVWLFATLNGLYRTRIERIGSKKTHTHI